MTMENGKAAPEDFSRGRVEALSDGVFAIVVTLLVLELRAPHLDAHESLAELGRALWALAPKFESWVISFVTVCVIWLNHHRLFKLLSRIDNGVFWLNANLLLWTSLIPSSCWGLIPREDSHSEWPSFRGAGRGWTIPRSCAAWSP